MPQKTRKEKERAAQRRESGQYKYPVAPAPIESPAPESNLQVSIKSPAAPAQPTTSAGVMARNMQGEFDYRYVYADLKRIGLLALVCFGIMFALAFVLR